MIAIEPMAIYRLQVGEEVYEVGSKFPGYPDQVVAKIDFLPATETRSVMGEQYLSEDEESPTNGAAKADAPTVIEREETVTRTPEQYLVLRMSADVYRFYFSAKQHILGWRKIVQSQETWIRGHDDLSPELYEQIAKLIQKHEGERLLVRHIISERRFVQSYDEESQLLERVLRMLLEELGEQKRMDQEQPAAEAEA